MGLNHLTDGLDDAQVAAVVHDGCNLAVLASAGSGKTRVLTRRAAHLMAVRKIDPAGLALVTFTRAAAAEIRARLVQLVGPAARAATVCTLHGLGWRLLRGPLADLSPAHASAEVLAEHVAAVRLWLLAHRPSPRMPMAAGLADRTTPAEHINGWMQAIAHARARGYTSARPPRQLAAQPLALWRAYQTYKHDHGLIDLDDLIDLPVRCAAGGAGAARLAGLFDAVLVDEVQDTSPVQLDLIDAIAPRGGLTVVGDLDQSIYRFRGAAPAELLSWIDRARPLPGPDRMVMIDLNRTYRCTEPITATAQRLIEHNRDRLPRTTVSLRGDGPEPTVEVSPRIQHEAWRISQLVLDASEQFADIAVLTRVRAWLAPIAAFLLDRDTPIVMSRRDSWLDTAAMRAVAGLARLVHGDGQALADLLCLPVPFGVGLRGGTEAAECLPADGWPDPAALPTPANRIASGYLQAVARVGGGPASPEVDPPAAKVIVALVDAANLTSTEQLNPDATQAALEILRAEHAGARTLPLSAYLGRLAALRAAVRDTVPGRRRPAVTLSTIHSAKGLEWPLVIVAGCVEGILPHARALTEPGGLEEERRLGYVAATRAGRTLIFTRTLRMPNGTPAEPSRFLAEMLLPQPDTAHNARPQRPANSTSTRACYLDQ